MNNGSTFLIAPYSVEGVQNATIQECADYLSTLLVIGIDIETTRKYPRKKYNEDVYQGGLDPYLSDIVMLQIGDISKRFVIDTRAYTKEELRPILRILHYNDRVTLVGHNLKFEGKHLRHKYGIRLKQVWCTMVTEIVLTNGLGLRLGLADLAGRYLGIQKKEDLLIFDDWYKKAEVTLDDELLEENEHLLTPFEVEDAFEIDKSTRLEFLTIGDKPFSKRQILYGADDIVHPILIRERQMLGRKISKEEIYLPVNCIKIENTFTQVLADLEYDGFGIVPEKWTEIAIASEKEFEKRRTELEDYVCTLFPQYAGLPSLFTEKPMCNIQWSSSKQVIKLFRDLEFCPQEYSKSTKKKEYSVGAKVLLRLIPQDYKENYQFNIWKGFEKDTSGVYIYKQEDLILAYLLLKKSEQACTTFGKEWLKYIHPITGRVHSSYRQIMSTGRMSSTNPNCLSLDTEVLTPTGWKKYNQVKKGDKVFAFNKYSNKLVVEEVTNYYQGEGDCVEFTDNRNFNAITTKNHRHLFKDRKTGEYKVRTSVNFLKDAHILNSSIVTEGLRVSEDFLVLLCATQADGWIPSRGDMYKDNSKKEPCYRVLYSFTKKRKSDRLRRSLDNLGITYTYKNTGRKEIFNVIYDIDYFKPYLTHNRKFEYALLKLDYVSRYFLLQELMHWDGSFTRKNNYSSSIESNIDIIEAIATITNIRVYKREYHNGNINSVINFQLDFVWEQPYTGTANTKIKDVGKQDVWCVTVPSSFIVCRRRFGSPFITGNCQNLPSGDYRNCFMALKLGKMINADYAAQEIRVLADVSGDPTFIEFFKNPNTVFGDDFHSYTATNVYRVLHHNPDLLIPNNKSPDFKKEYKKFRNNAKAINFKIGYGGSAFTMMEDFNSTLEEAQEIIDAYFEAAPTLKEDFETTKKQVLKDGFVRIGQFSGRMWFCPYLQEMEELRTKALEYYPDDYRDYTKEEKAEFKENLYQEYPEVRGYWQRYGRLKGGLERKGLNFRIQGTAADMTKIALNIIRHQLISNQITDYFLCNTIHDEILMESVPEKAEESAELLSRAMMQAGAITCKRVPIKAEAVVSDVWEH